MGEIDEFVERLRGYVDLEDSAPYFIRLEEEPNSNVVWVLLDKMYDEDFKPINLTSIWGEQGARLYKNAKQTK